MTQSRRRRLIGHELSMRAIYFATALFTAVFLAFVFHFTVFAVDDDTSSSGFAVPVMTFVIFTLIMLLVMEGTKTFTSLRMELTFQQSRRDQFTRTLLGRLVYAAAILLFLMAISPLLQSLARGTSLGENVQGLFVLLRPSVEWITIGFPALLIILTICSLFGHGYATGKRLAQVICTVLLVLVGLCPLLFIPEIGGQPLALVLLQNASHDMNRLPLALRCLIAFAILGVLVLSERQLLLRQEQAQ